jgi:hypothetical protein
MFKTTHLRKAASPFQAVYKENTHKLTLLSKLSTPATAQSKRLSLAPGTY